MTQQTDLESQIKAIAGSIRDGLGSHEPSPCQRALTTWGLGLPDRLLGGFSITIPEALGIVDVSAREYYTSALGYLYVNARAALAWSNELLVLRTDPYVEVEALGGRLNYPEHRQPWLAYSLLSRPADLARCRVPNPLRDGRMPVMVRVAALHRQHLGDVLPALVFCHSPLSLAVMMRGFRNLYEDAIRDLTFAHELLQFCCQTCVSFATAIMEAGVACLGVIAPWEALLRRDYPDIFDELALPYLSQLVRAASKSSGQCGPVLWSRGSTQVTEWQGYLSVLRGCGAGALTAGEEEVFGWVHHRETDVRELKDTVSSLGMVLVIQLSPGTVMRGRPDEVAELVRSLFAPAAESGGLVVTTTIPARATSAGIQGFTDALRACLYTRPSERT
ncbi:MAG: uroporphyrinogen decarboxylase family protein [Anaerolineae bacterium]